MKLLTIILFNIGLIIAIILLKYKPAYSVTITGEEIGFVNNKENFIETINEEILENKEQNAEFVQINVEPQYELKLIDKGEETTEKNILSRIKENTTTTYKYYEIAANDQITTYVNTLEEATDVVNQIKAESNKNDSDLNLQILEKYTESKDEIEVDSVETAKNNLHEDIINQEKQIQEQKEKAESEANVLANVNGIKISAKPVEGSISSRFGASSRRRRSSHTGLDIACKQGTSIKVVSDGKVTCASYNGSYGNLVKIDHGNGVETWYAHCSKILTSVGKQVKAGDIIAKVGSTGNSTGPHLHLEIRINGNPVNPQKYLYK